VESFFSDEKKKLLAHAPRKRRRHSELIIADLKRDVRTSIPLPAGLRYVYDMSFSSDGTCLLIAHSKGISKIDLTGDRIGEATLIRKRERFVRRDPGFVCFRVSFSPNSSKILVMYSLGENSDGFRSANRVIDLHTGKISWKEQGQGQGRKLSLWKAFVHERLIP
jgi:hypothetical protein